MCKIQSSYDASLPLYSQISENRRAHTQIHQPWVNRQEKSVDPSVNDGPGIRKGSHAQWKHLVRGHHGGNEANPHVDAVETVVDLISVLQTATASR